MSDLRDSRRDASVFRGSFVPLVLHIPLALILCAAVLPRACGDDPTSCSASHSPPHSPARGTCSASTDADGFPRYAAPVGEAPAGEAPVKEVHVGGKPVGGEARIGGAEGDPGERCGSSGGGSGREMEEEFDWLLDDADEDADGLKILRIEIAAQEEEEEEGEEGEEEERADNDPPEYRYHPSLLSARTIPKGQRLFSIPLCLTLSSSACASSSSSSPPELSPECYLAGCMLQAAAKKERAAEGLSWAALAGVLLPPVNLGRPLPLMLDDDLRMELSYKPLIDRLDKQVEQYQDEYDAWVNATVSQSTADNADMSFESFLQAVAAALSVSLPLPQAPSPSVPDSSPDSRPAALKRAAALEDRVVRAVLEVKRNVLSAAREAGGVTEGFLNSAARAGEGVPAQDGERGERGGEEHAMTGGKWYGMEQMWFWEMRRQRQLERERKKKEGEKHRMMRMKHEKNGKEEKEESVAGGVDPEGLFAYPEGRIDPELLAYLTALAYLRSTGREPDPAVLARVIVALAWNLDGTTTCTHMPLLSLPSHPLFLPHTSSSSTTSAPSASQSSTSTANHMPPPVADLLPALRAAAGMLRGLVLCLPWFMGALEEVQQVLQVRANKKRVLIDTSDWLLLACDPKYDLRLHEPEPVTAAAAESKRRRGDAAAEEDEEERSDEEKLGVFLEWVRARGIPDFGKPRSTFEALQNDYLSDFRPEPNSSHSPSLKAHGEFAASLLQAKARSRKQLTVVAGQSKKKGQLLLSIPHALWVSTHTMAEEAAPYANPVWTLAAGAAWLLREQARGRGSEWWPYLQILPAYVPLPFLFDAATLDELQSPSFVERIRMVREYYEQQYKLCRPPAIAFASLHQFLWALAVMNSRAFSTPAPARRTSAELHTDTTRFPQEEEREQERGRGGMLEQLLALPASERRRFVGEPMALVPIAELIDHHHPHNAQYKVQQSSFDFYAREEVQRGAELFTVYGYKPNHHLLLGYGFVLDDNPYDHVRLFPNLSRAIRTVASVAYHQEGQGAGRGVWGGSGGEVRPGEVDLRAGLLRVWGTADSVLLSGNEEIGVGGKGVMGGKGGVLVVHVMWQAAAAAVGEVVKAREVGGTYAEGNSLPQLQLRQRIEHRVAQEKKWDKADRVHSDTSTSLLKEVLVKEEDEGVGVSVWAGGIVEPNLLAALAASWHAVHMSQGDLLRHARLDISNASTLLPPTSPSPAAVFPHPLVTSSLPCPSSPDYTSLASAAIHYGWALSTSSCHHLLPIASSFTPALKASAETVRLFVEARLKQFPTSLEEDEAVLEELRACESEGRAGMKVEGWCEVVLPVVEERITAVRFRMHRKTVLKDVAARLRETCVWDVRKTDVVR
ncbi:unnamed protein product [Closterium sp. Naga37s-1]|nr:unnamed protein product [Closterium sp. Naga37s-1]